MSAIAIIGLDIAKNIFQVHGADANGAPVLKRQIRRGQILAFFANLPPSLVAIEAYFTTHFWAREIAKHGHEVRMIPPQYVKPFVKRNKTDSADARQSVKPQADQRCASSPSRASISKASWLCIGRGIYLSDNARN